MIKAQGVEGVDGAGGSVYDEGKPVVSIAMSDQT